MTISLIVYNYVYQTPDNFRNIQVDQNMTNSFKLTCILSKWVTLWTHCKHWRYVKSNSGIHL